MFGLAVGGLDPSGGAGLIVDVLTFSAFGLHPQAVMTASTIQSLGALDSYVAADAGHMYAQMHLIFETNAPAVLKIGMIGDDKIAGTLADVIGEFGAGIPVVLDPVLESSSGRPLITEAGLRIMIERLLPFATVVTPNRMEAERLSGVSITGVGDVRTAAEKILDMGADNVIVKGGHLQGEPTDYLFDGSRMHALPGKRVPDANVRGTGCMHASALAACLALGLDVLGAAREAKIFVTAAIKGAGVLKETKVKIGAIPAPGVWEIRKN